MLWPNPHLCDSCGLTHVSEEGATSTVLSWETHNQLMNIKAPYLRKLTTFKPCPTEFDTSTSDCSPIRLSEAESATNLKHPLVTIDQ